MANWDDYSTYTNPADDDTALLHDVSETTVGAKMKRITWANIKATLKTYFDTLYASFGGGGSSDGWNEDATNTWTYVSVDDPTGIIKINADVTGDISVGMRLKFTNGGNTIYGIVTVVGTYEGDEAGYTYITFLHEIDPTDSLALHLIANSAITATYFSPVKCPFGFPVDPTKWSITKSDTTNKNQPTPIQNTWYNLGSLSVNIPIGLWRIKYSLLPYGYRLGTANAVQLQISLSTSNNSVSDATLSAAEYAGILASNAELALSVNKSRPLPLSLASKTTYYFIMRTISANIDSIAFVNSTEALYLIAECAYL